jgi:MerR family copper efflux transcriptional regulator
MAHLDDIDERITDLQRIRRTPEGLIERCHGDHRSDCSILDKLADAKN